MQTMNATSEQPYFSQYPDIEVFDVHTDKKRWQCLDMQYKGVQFSEHWFIPWFGDVHVWYVIDLVLQEGTIPELDCSGRFYTNPGYGVPVVDEDIDRVVEIINWFKGDC